MLDNAGPGEPGRRGGHSLYALYALFALTVFAVHPGPRPSMRTYNFHHLMRDLWQEVDARRLDEIQATGRVARQIQQVLACSRVNFWRLRGPAGSRVMTRVAGYDAASDQVLTTALVLQETTGAFFDHLSAHGCYVCGDTAADPVLAAVFQTYLGPTAGLAMIVASFHLRGQAVGLVSCVHARPRRWTAAEITALRKCACEVSAHLERRAGQTAPAEPS